MDKKELKFIFAPIGVAVGITVFITLSILISKKLHIQKLSELFSFIPNIIFISIGIGVLLSFFPILIAGIYYLNRRGAVGQSDTLRTNGIYKYTRNPMYVGISMTIIGMGFILLNTGIIIGGVLWFIIAFFQCKREEKELLKRFGKEYIDYKKGTPMFLPAIPLLIKLLKNKWQLKFKKILKIMGIVIAILIIAILIGQTMSNSQLKKEVKTLFSLSGEVSNNIYTSQQIKDLPEPVKKYFEYSLNEGQKYISYLRLKHGGEFRTQPNQKWMVIKGEEYFTAENPGFVWFGKVPLVSAKDSYYNGKGNLKIKLLSTIKLADAKGSEFDQGEILRWLAETPLFPTALLPSENLKWEPIDNNSAKAILIDKNITIEGIFHFNEQGQIIEFNAKRYKDGDTFEDWGGYYRDYREIDGVKIPFSMEVVWHLESGDFSYAKFNIEEMEYDKPLKFK